MSSVPPPPPPPPPGGGDFNAPPPPAAGGAGGGAPIQNNLVIAIIGTVLGLCCNICLIPVGAVPGIIGIVFATQVNKLAAAGDIAGAQAKAKNAKILGLVSIGLGVVGIAFYIIWIAVNGSFSWNFNTTN